MKLIIESNGAQFYVYDVSGPEHVLRGTFLHSEDAQRFHRTLIYAAATTPTLLALNEVAAEVHRARVTLGRAPMRSAHEGWAVIYEEFIVELGAHVWMNQKKRDIAAMRAEAIQVAAMALCFAAEVCNEETGRK